jgi:S1-C subfamily serine protease
MRLRGWLFSVVFTAGMVSAGSACGVAGEIDAAQRARASMVVVSSKLTATSEAIGAGVVVAVQPQRIRVVTARHVAEHGPVSIWVNGRPWPAAIVRTFPDRDLAVVDAMGPDLGALRVAPATLAPAPAAGSPLYVWGEDAIGLHVEDARLVTTALPAAGTGGRRKLLSIACASCAPGDSGGGIFNGDGALLGILTARYRAADGGIVAVVGEPLDASVFMTGDGPFDAFAGTP